MNHCRQILKMVWENIRKNTSVHVQLTIDQYENLTEIIPLKNPRVTTKLLTVENLLYFIFVVHNILDDSDTDAIDKIGPDVSLSDYDFESYQDDLQHRKKSKDLGTCRCQPQWEINLQ